MIPKTDAIEATPYAEDLGPEVLKRLFALNAELARQEKAAASKAAPAKRGLRLVK